MMDMSYWKFWLLAVLAGTGIRIGFGIVGWAAVYVIHWVGACDCEEHG